MVDSFDDNQTYLPETIHQFVNFVLDVFETCSRNRLRHVDGRGHPRFEIFPVWFGIVRILSAPEATLRIFSSEKFGIELPEPGSETDN